MSEPVLRTVPNTLIAMRDLPYSGKSTAARALGHPIVSPDAIRLAMHGQRFRRESEPLVWTHARLMVASLFGAGHARVILDVCNASQRRLDECKDPLSIPAPPARRLPWD